MAGDDARRAIVSSWVLDPKFSSQTKDKLVSSSEKCSKYKWLGQRGWQEKAGATVPERLQEYLLKTERCQNYCRQRVDAARAREAAQSQRDDSP